MTDYVPTKAKFLKLPLLSKFKLNLNFTSIVQTKNVLKWNQAHTAIFPKNYFLKKSIPGRNRNGRRFNTQPVDDTLKHGTTVSHQGNITLDNTNNETSSDFKRRIKFIKLPIWIRMNQNKKFIMHIRSNNNLNPGCIKEKANKITNLTDNDDHVLNNINTLYISTEANSKRKAAKRLLQNKEILEIESDLNEIKTITSIRNETPNPKNKLWQSDSLNFEISDIHWPN